MTAQTSPLVPSPNPIDRLYRLVASDRAPGALFMLLALSVLAGMLLPPAPSNLAESDTTARWLAETSSRYGSVGGVLQSAGLFDLWHSAWFRGRRRSSLYTAAAARVGNRRRCGNACGIPMPQAPLRRPALALARTIELDRDSVSAVAELSEDLLNEGWRIVSAEAVSGAVIVAERSPWGLVAIPLVYAGGLRPWQASGLDSSQAGTRATWRCCRVSRCLAPRQPAVDRSGRRGRLVRHVNRSIKWGRPG